MNQRIAFAILVALAIAAPAGAAVEYTVMDLGNLLETSINDAGQVIGYSRLPDGMNHVFLYSGGTLNELPNLPGETGSNPGGINNQGQVVGTAMGKTAAGEYQHPFLYSGGQIHDLGTLSPGNANGINDAGMIVGNSAGAPTEIYLYTGGAWHDLGIGGLGRAINASGQIAGTTGISAPHAFLYGNGVFTDLGALAGAAQSDALALNSAGEVVGQIVSTGGFGHAFVYKDGKILDINSALPHLIDSTAAGVNDLGQVVGSGQYQGGINVAFLYEAGKMTDLSTLLPSDSGWKLDGASAINNVGQIVASGTNSTGQPHTLLLTPIPEPQSVAFLGMSIAMLVRRRGRGN